MKRANFFVTLVKIVFEEKIHFLDIINNKKLHKAREENISYKLERKKDRKIVCKICKSVVFLCVRPTIFASASRTKQKWLEIKKYWHASSFFYTLIIYSN